MGIMPQFVQAALSALRHLQPIDRTAAIAILSLWAHRDEIDIERVVTYYFAGYSPAGPRISEVDLRAFASRAADLGFAIDPDGDPAYLVSRLNALLSEGVAPTPPESEWVQPPACPAWCNGTHPDDGQFRDCSSEDTFVPQVGENGVVSVNVETTFNRATGVRTAPKVRLEDYLLMPQYARHLGQLLIRAADLIDG
ncbi:hypothetical protein [Actinoplanes sp. NPDC051851]|uniref:hypothetical protein n=1 Tax=Actinoplanes sp. NPDC051851 TaxID=3154753 RepID=UPI003431DA3C